ncbi:STAS domain-containing protein [Amycolatopsis sp. OK19-0408]|uniref:STAS domain-containing protein n=1 Tax=Amycolatopsis iheyensis TaxID=2945988 RepID=A0A9X2NBT7_9PSEU|nr:STAS domain-containing protein [Amycolatopsis iheyensis]MCR6483799.1 STAS domain-containing protein [Amycolatopsis iheyensis]
MTTHPRLGEVGTTASPARHLPSPRAPADLHSEVRWRSSEAIVVRVTGEIDTCTAMGLERTVREHLRARPAALRVDMGEVSFFGAAGLRALHRARLLADDAGVHLVVDAGGSLAVQRALDLLDRICAASSSRA